MTPALYRLATRCAAPLMPLLLRRRLARGKEDAARLPERLGFAGIARPEGKLVWMHAASVGEALSLLPLIDALSAKEPQATILLTTGTVTSAAMLKTRLPAGVIHQFAPVDTPQAVGRFLAHWRPDAALWAESELWPNLVLLCRRTGCRMLLANARMSQRSYRGWRRFPSLIRAMLQSFEAVFAQSEGDAVRLRTLGASEVRPAGNLKFDAVPLPCDETLLAALRGQIGDRPCWLAASTHPGEEELIAQAHREVKEKFPGLLTVIVPRHASRGGEIAGRLRGMMLARRSLGEEIIPDVEIYLADTMGEMGVFYRACNLAFLGGSLVPHGGQNALEAVRLGCPALSGPYAHNFAAIVNALEEAGGLKIVPDSKALAEAVLFYLGDAPARESMARRAAEWLNAQRGASKAVAEALARLLSGQKSEAA